MLHKDVYTYFTEIIKPVPGLHEHSHRTALMLNQMASQISRITSADPSLLVIGGYLHDIGKAKWPIGLSSKKKLDVSDWSLIHSHPNFGTKIIKDVWPAAPKLILDIVGGHHERPKGKGYPNRMVKVPIEVQIVSAIEAYDAMTSDRPYRAALSHRQAMSELEKDYSADILSLFVVSKKMRCAVMR